MYHLQDLKQKLNELGISPKRALGQNFLVSEHAIAKIIARVQQMKAQQYVEVGPGLGALTERLLKMDAPLKVIELDRIFSQYWRDKGVEVYEGDALKLKWEELHLPESTCLVSNLPYQISSSLVIERSLGPRAVSSMVLMFQKEVAQRLAASPKSKDYGLLTVIAQTFWDVKLVLEAGPNDFYPPPKIASRVLSFERKPQPVADPKDFLAFIKSSFMQRRKLLTKNVISYVGKTGLNQEAVVEILEEMGLSGKCRAEELSPQDFLKLYEQLNLRRKHGR